MKTIEEFKLETGDPETFAQGYVDSSIKHAFIDFTENCLGGCWNEKYGLLCIVDEVERHKGFPPSYSKIYTIAELDAKEEAYRIKNEYKQRDRARKQRHDERKFKWSDQDATVERPWAVRLYGNDDFTWGIWVETREKAEEIFNEIVAFEPWDYNELMDMYPFVFTN